MKRTVLISAMVLALIFCWSMTYAEDGFYVIVGKKRNYAPVEKTGQTTTYITGDDGYLRKGVAWPNPRFFDNGDGTVTDKLTGLVWLKNANCFNSRGWADALSDCNSLENGSCGLTDGSNAGDWHLPNRKELLSLLDLGCRGPALPDTTGAGKWSEGDPFTGVQSAYYWTSTYYTDDINYAWGADMNDSKVTEVAKSNYCYVWPVRDGN
jgi:hypothetical protein